MRQIVKLAEIDVGNENIYLPVDHVQITLLM